MGGLPKLLDFFQDKSDKLHELALARLQIERELELRKAGFEAMERIEHIRMKNLRASVRPVITYGFFFLLVFVDVGLFVYGWHNGVTFVELAQMLWDSDTQALFASIIAFHFGGRAFGK